MASPYPVLEIAIVNIKSQKVEDESTKEGKAWREIFHDVTDVPGFIRVGWGRSVRDNDINLFYVEWDSYRHHHEFMEAQGTLSAPIMKLLNAPFDMYHIKPTSANREPFYAPYSAIVYFWGIDEVKFGDLVKPWITAISKSDSCLGYLWGEVMNPPRMDTSKNMDLGKGVIMLSGWKSKEEHDYDCSRPRVVDAYKAVQAAVKKFDTYPIRFHCVEKSKMEINWRQL